jgi:hypothetical protein
LFCSVLLVSLLAAKMRNYHGYCMLTRSLVSFLLTGLARRCHVLATSNERVRFHVVESP